MHYCSQLHAYSKRNVRFARRRYVTGSPRMYFRQLRESRTRPRIVRLNTPRRASPFDILSMAMKDVKGLGVKGFRHHDVPRGLAFLELPPRLSGSVMILHRVRFPSFPAPVRSVSRKGSSRFPRDRNSGKLPTSRDDAKEFSVLPRIVSLRFFPNPFSHLALSHFELLRATLIASKSAETLRGD